MPTTASIVPSPDPRKGAPFTVIMASPTTKTMIPITATATTLMLLLFRAAMTLTIRLGHTAGLLRI